MKKFKLIPSLLAVFFITSAFADFKNVKKSTNYILETSFEHEDDCDKFLKSYEEFMVAYIAVYKKYLADPTNMSVMTDYTKLAANATKFSSMNTDNCSPEQLIKLSEIVLKLNTSLLALMSM
jgi:hypothetical protein